ncbi:MAG: 5-formaminoimidazole-4-carboxamide-1-(beta)-D-ribofuranosyl 5'-monophosphate synthetase [Candidatus Altiarchaeales archaeon]|nr:MAG: 5-formaminoimidazole-4-carboxamide-1-(beta)-D-ribofuranosyl 5'-monophosphate synthetase [Candidatus Altiarchaeales archaeon]
MIPREKIFEILENYDKEKIKIGVLASHSALDVADGAIEEGFETVLYCQKGREKTYTKYFKAKRNSEGKVIRGVVDHFKIYEKFSEMISAKEQEQMRKNNVLFIPNRSFTSYISLDKIENDFLVPLVGSRNLLRTENRGEERDYYWLLEKAKLPYPEPIENPEDIDELCIVKLHHAKKKLERGFFTAASFKEYKEKSEKLIKLGVITKEDLENARIERYIIGPVFNLDFFYSPLEKDMSGIELLGIDFRFETSLDGHVRLPAEQQLTLPERQRLPEYTVCGHSFATLRESLLEKAFELAEKYVKATQRYFKPGIIGPFCLQTCVDKDLNFYIYDVAPRIGGGTNAHMFLGHSYGNILFRKRMSTGRRLALEIRRAIELDSLEQIVT